MTTDMTVYGTASTHIPSILAPGFYDSDEIRAAYHSDPCPEPSLSRSVAYEIVTRTPGHARVMHPRLNPDHEETHDEKFDIGSAAHKLILGKGRGVHIIDAKDYRTDAAKFARDTARGRGMVPMLTHQYKDAEKLVDAFNAQLGNFGLADILSEDTGRSEVVAAWRDPVGGWCRVMFDRLQRNLAIWDVKTTKVDITEETLGRHCASMHYEFQNAFYERGLEHLFPEMKGRVEFGLIFVEVNEPFAIMPVRLPRDALAKGRHMVAKAMERWAEAKRDGVWPMYSGQVRTVEYPPWEIAEFTDYQEDAP